MRVEAYFREELSAGLFQKTGSVPSQSTSLVVLQPTQTETSLLPLFNKVAIRLPPIIGKWALGMQDDMSASN